MPGRRTSRFNHSLLLRRAGGPPAWRRKAIYLPVQWRRGGSNNKGIVQTAWPENSNHLNLPCPYLCLPRDSHFFCLPCLPWSLPLLSDGVKRISKPSLVFVGCIYTILKWLFNGCVWGRGSISQTIPALCASPLPAPCLTCFSPPTYPQLYKQ